MRELAIAIWEMLQTETYYIPKVKPRKRRKRFRLPCEYLTEEQLAALSGPVITYKVGE